MKYIQRNICFYLYQNLFCFRNLVFPPRTLPSSTVSPELSFQTQSRNLDFSENFTQLACCNILGVCTEKMFLYCIAILTY